MSKAISICPKCKNKINITQSIRGYYHIFNVNDDGTAEGRYSDSMSYGKYKCENCNLSSWNFDEMIERKEIKDDGGSV